MNSVQRMDSQVSVDVMHFCTLSPFFCGQNNNDIIHSPVRNNENTFDFVSRTHPISPSGHRCAVLRALRSTGSSIHLASNSAHECLQPFVSHIQDQSRSSTKFCVQRGRGCAVTSRCRVDSKHSSRGESPLETDLETLSFQQFPNAHWKLQVSIT